MRSNDKESFKIFELIRNEYAVPFLSAAGFKAAKKGNYEQLRDDTINRIAIDGRTDRRGDICYIEDYLSITYRQIGELLAEHLGSRKQGMDSATRTIQLHRVAPATGSWDQGFENPRDWRTITPEKDPAVLGPILVDELRQFAIPFFEARSSMSVILDSSRLKPDGADYDRHLFLKPAAIWLNGSHGAAIDLLKAREAELDEDFRIKGLIKCGEFLDTVRNFRLFLEKREAKQF